MNGQQALAVKLCFAHAVPAATRLHAGPAARWASNALLEGSRVGARPSQKLARTPDGHLILPALPPHSCIRYLLELKALERRPHTTQTWLLPIGAWLWRPDRALLNRWGPRGTLSVHLPADLHLSVPFPATAPHRYTLPASTFMYSGRSLLGRYAHARFTAHNCLVDLAFTPNIPEPSQQALIQHIREAMAAVSTVLGHFPAPKLQILVNGDRAQANQAIGFGQLTRGGGAGVSLWVKPTLDASELRSAWTCVHEFAHLLLPFVRREDAWLSEGIATYYQEVLRARTGMITPIQALLRLHDGAIRLASADAPLAELSRQMSRQGAYRQVYWGGASFALRLDAMLLRKSAGKLGLDTLIRGIANRMDYQAPPQSGRDLLGMMDKLLGNHRATKLANAHIHATPPASGRATLDALRALGIGRQTGTRTPRRQQSDPDWASRSHLPRSSEGPAVGEATRLPPDQALWQRLIAGPKNTNQSEEP